MFDGQQIIAVLLFYPPDNQMKRVEREQFVFSSFSDCSLEECRVVARTKKVVLLDFYNCPDAEMVESANASRAREGPLYHFSPIGC